MHLVFALQTGLFQLVRDYSVDEFKKNVLALAATAKLYGVPTILTTSLESKCIPSRQACCKRKWAVISPLPVPG